MALQKDVQLKGATIHDAYLRPINLGYNHTEKTLYYTMGAFANKEVSNQGQGEAQLLGTAHISKVAVPDALLWLIYQDILSGAAAGELNEEFPDYPYAALSGAESLMDDVPEAAQQAAVQLYPEWETGKEYAYSDIFRYRDKLYKVLQEHTSQADWLPDAVPALYLCISDPAVEWPDWKQPQGAHDAYRLGAKVSHNGKHWINEIDHNVHEPGVSGWKEVVNG